jgi:predicted nucleotidyltransferase
MDAKLMIELDADVLAGLGHLNRICGNSYFVVGAAARDILMQYHKLQPSRATRDADLAVQVSGWVNYENLRIQLIASGFREQSTTHSLTYQSAIFDVIPFGGILNGKSEILWPQDGKIMNMLGFDDAFRTAHKFKTTTGSDVRIASLSSLVMLKVIAWNDRPRDRPQDPADVNSIIENYLDAGNLDRFYDEHSDLVEMERFTMERAGAGLIGRDLYTLCSNRPLMEMRHILERELALAEESIFFQQMAGNRSLDPYFDKISFMLSQMR